MVGMPPTYCEMSKAFGLYPNAIRDHIKALERKGWISILRRYGETGRSGSLNRCLVIEKTNS